MRAYTDVASIEADFTKALDVLWKALNPKDGSPEDTAWNEVATFGAVALLVMKKTNPSKVRDCARTVEIKCRMDGIPVITEAA